MKPYQLLASVALPLLFSACASAPQQCSSGNQADAAVAGGVTQAVGDSIGRKIGVEGLGTVAGRLTQANVACRPQ